MTRLEITLLIFITLLIMYAISSTIFYIRQINYLFRVFDVKNKTIKEYQYVENSYNKKFLSINKNINDMKQSKEKRFKDNDRL